MLAPRGLREEENLTHSRIPREFFVVVQRQARRVWVATIIATVIFTASAVVLATLRR